MSRNRVISMAESQIGVMESPAGSNRQLYGEAYGTNGVPWCVIFLWWVFDQAGTGAAFYGGGKTASCSALISWAVSHNRIVDIADIAPGDIVFLCFDKSRVASHCGLVTNVTEGNIVTVEGNTTAGNGSQDNGGCVCSKVRTPAQVVRVMRPAYLPEDCLSSWAKEDIRKCIERNVMIGYPSGDFKPKQTVTREELAHILAKVI